ncbi:MAG: HAD family hydrolase [Candidatus Liptonbacteria bacterium CG11_big_fil_rev_8_21_14_0_20_35_14]|uniref:phosphomannomutase n=1 Tax=Candidatus Liptonbacteria bacterium CG11_big_fil_rev_8_21_14_0_20_35_14 TaxID=1974634 RepID=A0A2H0N7R4_9BACT|nr:MAG: HAD family hydrolase [Candidatus Liptonbacteria bacterium CG11_big_fil_rev_8_21_14_0_20_35_14]
MNNEKKNKKIVELTEQAKKLLTKKVIVFDLDGTLTESKSNLGKEMAVLLCALLGKRKVAVMGGGNREQFQRQLLTYLHCAKTQLENLFILPTSGASFFKFQKNNWRKVYQHRLSQEEKTKIFNAFEMSFKTIGYLEPKKTYGKIIEDRESQITFSALGQKAPLIQKENWNKNMDMRRELKITLEKHLPKFEVRLGGLTSIDITKKDLDKAFGVQEIMKALSVSKKDIVYIGDALYEGGNDFAVIKTGINTIQISGPANVKYLINKLLTKK